MYQFHVFFILCIFISESKSLISRENIFKIEIVKVDTHIHFTSFFGTYYFWKVICQCWDIEFSLQEHLDNYGYCFAKKYASEF